MVFKFLSRRQFRKDLALFLMEDKSYVQSIDDIERVLTFDSVIKFVKSNFASFSESSSFIKLLRKYRGLLRAYRIYIDEDIHVTNGKVCGVFTSGCYSVNIFHGCKLTLVCRGDSTVNLSCWGDTSTQFLCFGSARVKVTLHEMSTIRGTLVGDSSCICTTFDSAKASLVCFDCSTLSLYAYGHSSVALVVSDSVLATCSGTVYASVTFKSYCDSAIVLSGTRSATFKGECFNSSMLRCTMCDTSAFTCSAHGSSVVKVGSVTPDRCDLAGYDSAVFLLPSDDVSPDLCDSSATYIFKN